MNTLRPCKKPTVHLTLDGQCRSDECDPAVKVVETESGAAENTEKQSLKLSDVAALAAAGAIALIICWGLVDWMFLDDPNPRSQEWCRMQGSLMDDELHYPANPGASTYQLSGQAATDYEANCE